eukprot:CAMPEP_0119403800 /NCGR_PEP_ID=MMETSP1334-20130426/143568_1 /TAXON_ID=127549 /ORGANISM="Calcidiscus leptoporus, Strain RCC1130" /LENGTH=63 /DNA_ID=CAMNT_0007427751 /DNA_START=62 /DNA_END=253 /DNA_ORIENTATION=-
MALKRNGTPALAMLMSAGPKASVELDPAKPAAVAKPIAEPRTAVAKSSTVNVLSVDQTISIDA